MSSTDSNTDSGLLVGPLENVVSEKFQGEVSEEALAALAEAVETTKKTILETEENSESRKLLVKRLIELRIRHEDVKERMTNKASTAFETKGHIFVDLYDPLTNYSNLMPYWMEGRNKVYCQVCGTSIWIYLQSSQHCRECGFYAHQSCLPHTKRECVAIKIKTKPDFIMNVCPEKSLLSLNYRCSECRQVFIPDNPMYQPRLCNYTGLYYCPSCHWDAKGVTPARIVRNWDFSKQYLCQASKQYLALMVKKPVINIEKANPKLYAAVQELNEVKTYRQNILLMKKYLMVCRVATQEKLLLLLSDRQHFVEDDYMYSIQDLLDTHSGELLTYLERIHKIYSDHITLNCVLCSAKGFICELCDEKDEILFPFSQTALICQLCNGVFHRHCYRANSNKCPKCIRLQQRAQK